MSKDLELQRRRRLAILDILKDGDPVADQGELVKRLRELGFSVTQPSVSRDLQELGAVRSGGRYQISSWTEGADESPFREVQGLILTITPVGPNQIFMRTLKGAGTAVAAAIDESNWEDLVGTVAGHSSVLLLTENKLLQDLVMLPLTRIRRKLDHGVEA